MNRRSILAGAGLAALVPATLPAASIPSKLPELIAAHQIAYQAFRHLLGVLYEVTNDLDFVAGNVAAERLHSLLILARDEAERIDAAIGDAITTRKVMQPMATDHGENAAGGFHG